MKEKAYLERTPEAQHAILLFRRYTSMVKEQQRYDSGEVRIYECMCVWVCMCMLHLLYSLVHSLVYILSHNSHTHISHISHLTHTYIHAHAQGNDIPSGGFWDPDLSMKHPMKQVRATCHVY